MIFGADSILTKDTGLHLDSTGVLCHPLWPGARSVRHQLDDSPRASYAVADVDDKFKSLEIPGESSAIELSHSDAKAVSGLRRHNNSVGDFIAQNDEQI